jgi:hypothetical protein
VEAEGGEDFLEPGALGGREAGESSAATKSGARKSDIEAVLRCSEADSSICVSKSSDCDLNNFMV